MVVRPLECPLLLISLMFNKQDIKEVSKYLLKAIINSYLVGRFCDLLLDWSTKWKRPLKGLTGLTWRRGRGWWGGKIDLWWRDRSQVSTLLIGVLCWPWAKSPKARGKRQKPTWNRNNTGHDCGHANSSSTSRKLDWPKDSEYYIGRDKLGVSKLVQ